MCRRCQTHSSHRHWSVSQSTTSGIDLQSWTWESPPSLARWSLPNGCCRSRRESRASLAWPPGQKSMEIPGIWGQTWPNPQVKGGFHMLSPSNNHKMQWLLSTSLGNPNLFSCFHGYPLWTDHPISSRVWKKTLHTQRPTLSLMFSQFRNGHALSTNER